MSPFLHILNGQLPSWLSGWPTVKFHGHILLGSTRVTRFVTLLPLSSERPMLTLDAWHPVPFLLTLVVPLLYTAAPRAPSPGDSVSTLLSTVNHSEEQRPSCTY